MFSRVTILIKLVFYVLLILAFSCKEKPAKKKIIMNGKSSKTILDTSKFAILSFESSGRFGFDSTYSPATLNDSDLLKLESLIYKSIEDYNSKLSKENIQDYRVDTIELHYKMQIVPAMNNEGQKEVWVNGFCSSWNGWQEPFNHDWKVQLVLVKDGGNCFFNFKINLDENKTYYFSVNGYA